MATSPYLLISSCFYFTATSPFALPHLEMHLELVFICLVVCVWVWGCTCRTSSAFRSRTAHALGPEQHMSSFRSRTAHVVACGWSLLRAKKRSSRDCNIALCTHAGEPCARHCGAQLMMSCSRYWSHTQLMRASPAPSVDTEMLSAGDQFPSTPPKAPKPTVSHHTCHSAVGCRYIVVGGCFLLSVDSFLQIHYLFDEEATKEDEY